MGNNRVAVLGYMDGSAGQIECWFEEATGMKIDCFIEDSDNPPYVDIAQENSKRANKRTSFPENGRFKNYPLLASSSWPEELRKRGIGKVLPLTGQNSLRIQQVQRCREAGFELVSAIHPSVLILADAIVEPGVWINAGSIIGYKAEIRPGVLVHTRVTIEHHNVLMSGCQLDPGVTTAGNVTVWECAHVHTGAIIINRMNIGAGAIVGAGAVVIKDVPSNTTVVGVPARVIKTRNA